MQGAWPSFDLSGVELLLALVRGLFVATLLSVFGASLFGVLIAPTASKQRQGNPTEIDRRCLRVARWSTLSALLLMPLWLALQARIIADAETPIEVLAAIPSVTWDTRFGHIFCAQALALLATATALLIDRRGLLMATGLAGSAMLLQAGHTHALAMHDGPLLLANAFT